MTTRVIGLTSLIWDASVFAGSVILVLFLLWAGITKEKTRMAFGFFPGMVGIIVVNAATF